MKLKLIIFFTLFLTLSVLSQSMDKEHFNKVMKGIVYKKNDVEKADLYLKAARYCLEKEGEFKTDLDSASLLNNQSIQISRKFDLKENIAQSMLLDGEIAKERGHKDLAVKLKNKALEYAIKNDLKKEQAAVYISLGYNMPENETSKKEEYYKKAIQLYRETGAFYDEAETFVELSIIHNSIDDPATSIKFAKQAIKIKKRIKRHDVFKEYTMLSLNFRVQGNYKNALSYALAAEKITENLNGNEKWLNLIYDLLGTIYSELKIYDKSVEYYKKAIVIAKKCNDAEAVNAITLNTARGLYSRGKNAEALEVLNSSYKYYSDKNCNAEYPSLYILVYCSLKKYNKAKPYYDQLVKCSNDVNNLKYKDHIEQEKMYYAMIHFLLKTGQADKTYVYINKLKELAKLNNDLYNLSQLERTYYKSDSATGNYQGAFNHLKMYKQLNDSLFNLERTKQLSDLQVKYETDKKDKNIKLLKQKGILQETRLHNELVIRYVFIAGLIILFILSILLYSRYCMKRKSNTILEQKRAEINRQNKKLRQLVDEKEWLLKEIHHRVKNNLQIVISLLNTQSAYLENEDALLAIQNSQHRMHAMSLIHQKLYQTENLSSIDMSWYIQELVNYLKDSFGTDNKIKFTFETEPIELDVAQAVPLGLILNEAISNAIKYAFPENKGLISIVLKEKSNCKYTLQIADNGIGLQPDFDSAERDSLGMNLMIGLAEQLDGSFNIASDNGVIITVNFIKREAEI
ncbi:histidine kinase dimerization/phosphoacceptor domain -containing protein [Flavobacterium sp. NRK1]|uniref:tetratricopeptide repeat-containing sensor histidine kinase n=1 Tax=Flavobacterium sp. NRK1 TaxID=2954929 RepID=UPI002092D24A|nr:histidine kinase dimerization/phosphoacceptor domain -containing protein [Flavobacterium sp. NRK1]MCO6149207.1 hypothetical protein [Flavobacterium sp. NRK1]